MPLSMNLKMTTLKRIVRIFLCSCLRVYFNSRRNIDHSMVDLVFKASESTVPQMEIYRYLYSRCKILLAFCWYQYFDDPNFLSELNLSKTRGRSASFRRNNNLNEFITYGMT